MWAGVHAYTQYLEHIILTVLLWFTYNMNCLLKLKPKQKLYLVDHGKEPLLEELS